MNLIKNSLIYKFIVSLCLWCKNKWDNSTIGYYFTRDLDDNKFKNSLIYKILNKPVLWLSNLQASEKIKKLGQTSLLIKYISKYHLFVYATIFLAPFVPTFACLALVGISFFSYFIHRIFINAQPIKLDGFGILVILLLLIFGVCTVTSLAVMSSIKIYMVYLPFIAFVFVVIKALDTKEKAITAITVFIAAGVFVSLYGIYQQFFGNNLGHAWLDDEMFEQITVRVYSTLENPNVLGEYLLLALPLAAGMIWGCKKFINKVLFAGAFGIMALCMIFTQSRGCWLGLILAAAVFVVLVDKRFIIAGILLLCALPFVLPESIITRFTSIGDLSDSSSSYRLYIWLGTINMLKDFALYGIGLGSDAYNQIYPFYSYSGIIAPHAHNLYLQIMCETGIAGLLTFVILMFVTLKKIYLGFISDRKGIVGICCAGVLVGLLGFLLQGMFDYVWYNYRVMLLFRIFIGIGLGCRRVLNDKNNTHNK